MLSLIVIDIGWRLTLGNLTKNQQTREILRADVEQSKQSTIDDLAYQFNIQKGEKTKPTKAIIIDRVATTIKEDELALKTEFKLIPSSASFSKINLDLYFQDHLLKATQLDIPQSALLNINLEYPQILDMKGMAEGNYIIRVEMYELWSKEKMCFATKEIVVQYTPQTRESRLIKIPTLKNMGEPDLVISSSTAKNIYRKIEQGAKQESLSKRDEW